MRIQVHDEINLSLPAREKAEYYQDIMEHCLDMEVQVKAEPVVCENWGKAKQKGEDMAINGERTNKQSECMHKDFEVIYIYQGVVIGYCPTCDMVVKMDLYALEESFYGI